MVRFDLWARWLMGTNAELVTRLQAIDFGQFSIVPRCGSPTYNWLITDLRCPIGSSPTITPISSESDKSVGLLV